MYHFGTAVLLGLGVFAIVSLVRHLVDTPRALRILLDLALGLLFAWATDYSVFRGWGIEFRQGWMGPVGTGLVVGGVATLFHDLMGLVTSFARRQYDQAAEIEARIPRKAA
jgi:hypothetical protein